MIFAQLLLTVAVLVACYKFLISPNSAQTKAWKKILLLLMVIFAVIVIFFPGLTNKIAHALGIGRGADLLLYILTVAFIFEELNHYMKEKEDQKRTVVLARKIALLEAGTRNSKK